MPSSRSVLRARDVGSRRRLGRPVLLLAGSAAAAAALLRGSASAFLAARSSVNAPTARAIARGEKVRRAARGGDEDEDEEDDYEFSGGVYNIDTLKVGQKMEGVVVNIREFGAFVDFGADSQGLVPLGKMAEGRVEDVSEHVKVGDNVNVWVSEVKNGRVTLAMTPSKIYGPGGGADISLFNEVSDTEWLTGTVVKVMPFGAFVQVPAPGTEMMAQGLCHISQMANERVEDPNTLVSTGDEVKVRVIQVDTDKKKLSFSMKEKGGAGGGGARDVSAFADISDEEWLDGTVKKIVNFGAFVEVTAPSGGSPVQGLVHLSQIRDGFVEDAGEELEVDQEIKVRVVSCDTEKGKVDFSMKEKQGSAQPEPEPEAQAA